MAGVTAHADALAPSAANAHRSGMSGDPRGRATPEPADRGLASDDWESETDGQGKGVLLLNRRSPFCGKHACWQLLSSFINDSGCGSALQLQYAYRFDVWWDQRRWTVRKTRERIPFGGILFVVSSFQPWTTTNIWTNVAAKLA